MITSKTVKTNHSTEAEEIGPNGHRVGYTENGDKVEWLPDQENPGEEVPLLLRRNDKDINDACNEFWEKVWWSRNVAQRQQIALAQQSVPESQWDASFPGKQALERIEEKYGKETLGWSVFELGVLNGRLSALSWVLGDEWDESLDT